MDQSISFLADQGKVKLYECSTFFALLYVMDRFHYYFNCLHGVGSSRPLALIGKTTRAFLFL